MSFSIELPRDWLDLLILAAVGFALSVIFTTVSILAAGRVIQLILNLWAFGPDKMARVKRLIKASTAVVAAAAVLVGLIWSFIK